MTRLLHQQPCAAECSEPPRKVRNRAFRVLLLSFVIVVLSLVDLYCTLLYLHSGGMSEDNPIARRLMETGNPGWVVLWKVATVGTACLIFILVRRHRFGEVGAWVSCLVLVWLTMRWVDYSNEIKNLTPSLHTVAQTQSERWVTMGN